MEMDPISPVRRLAEDCLRGYSMDFIRTRNPVRLRPRALRLRDSGLLDFVRHTLPEECECVDHVLDLTDEGRETIDRKWGPLGEHRGSED